MNTDIEECQNAIKQLIEDLAREKEVNKLLKASIAPTLAHVERLVIENGRLRATLGGIMDMTTRSLMEPNHGPK